MKEYYRHFKGNIYRILHIAKHSETLEDIVVYQAMYGERSIWVRPKAMFIYLLFFAIISNQLANL